MKWLVEEYDDHVKDLVAEIKKQGHEVDFIRYYDMIQDPNYLGTGLPRGKGEFADEECVLFYGSIQLAKWLFRNKRWIPTVWYNYDKYKVSHWAAELGQFMLNSDFMILPKGEITRRGLALFEHYKAMDIFIRPDNGTKSFGGRVFSYEDWHKDWLNASHMMEEHELCVLAHPTRINKEWRFICEKDQIISSSLYKIDGSAEIQHDYDSDAYDFCRKVISRGYHPDPLYTVDIGKSGDGYYLIELNNFCCSGLYACGLSKIVRRASELAIIEHKDFFTPTLEGC